MKLDFKPKKLKKASESGSKLIQRYGPIKAELIETRINELRSAECILDIPPQADCHPLHNNLRDKFSVKTKQPYRILFAPEPPYDEEDLSNIRGVIILDLNIDYH